MQDKAGKSSTAALLASVFAVLGLVACGGGGGGSTDAPGASPLAARQVACSYDHVSLTVERVRVRVASNEERWIEIHLQQPRQIDHPHGCAGGTHRHAQPRLALAQRVFAALALGEVALQLDFRHCRRGDVGKRRHGDGGMRVKGWRVGIIG